MWTVYEMEQMSVFDYDKKPLKIDKPIRLIELFAGIGSQAKALKNIGADFEHYRVCEFDKYAIASYNAIHGTNFETSDITKLKGGDLGIKDLDKFTYIMTYSFPCQ
jgi:DNA (cytosine-5)-methyltransferase 1